MPFRRPQTPQSTGPVVPVEITAPKGVAIKVLLLEDRSDFRNVLREHLVACDYEVISVASGIEGLRKVMMEPVDIILCDMMMPQMGGEMFYWAVTRVRPGARQRFIFLPATRTIPHLNFSFAACARGCSTNRLNCRHSKRRFVMCCSK